MAPRDSSTFNSFASSVAGSYKDDQLLSSLLPPQASVYPPLTLTEEIEEPTKTLKREVIKDEKEETPVSINEKNDANQIMVDMLLAYHPSYYGPFIRLAHTAGSIATSLTHIKLLPWLSLDISRVAPWYVVHGLYHLLVQEIDVVDVAFHAICHLYYTLYKTESASIKAIWAALTTMQMGSLYLILFGTDSQFDAYSNCSPAVLLYFSNCYISVHYSWSHLVEKRIKHKTLPNNQKHAPFVACVLFASFGLSMTYLSGLPAYRQGHLLLLEAGALFLGKIMLDK